jgi:hypothetical protein
MMVVKHQDRTAWFVFQAYALLQRIDQRVHSKLLLSKRDPEAAATSCCVHAQRLTAAAFRSSPQTTSKVLVYVSRLLMLTNGCTLSKVLPIHLEHWELSKGQGSFQVCIGPPLVKRKPLVLQIEIKMLLVCVRPR